MRSTLFLRNRTTKLYENNNAEIGKNKEEINKFISF